MRMRNIRIPKSETLAQQPLTSHRRLLFNLLRDSDGHLDAKELFRRASSLDRSISLATIYRGLRFFKESGLVNERRLGQVRCYEVKDLREHQHMICGGCGKVIEFESPLIPELIDSVQHDRGFRVTKIELCLEGYCRECRPELEHL